QFHFKRRETKKRIKSYQTGNGIDVLVFRNQQATRGVTPDLREARMPKKCPDKQQNQESRRSRWGAILPQPAPVDDEAFARRAGKIIANSSTSLHKARDAGGNKRARRSG